LSCSYPRPPAFIRGQEVFFSSLLGIWCKTFAGAALTSL
jgi:hypothetical protein